MEPKKMAGNKQIDKKADEMLKAATSPMLHRFIINTLH